MDLKISKGWMIFSGIIFALLGIYVFIQPANALVSLVWYIAITKAVTGTVGIVTHIRLKEVVHKGNLYISLLDLIAGLILLFSGLVKLELIVMLPYIIGSWLVIRGGLMVYASFKDRNELDKWWITALLGVLSFFAGIIMFMYPIFSTIVITQYVGIILILIGIIALIQGCYFNKK